MRIDEPELEELSEGGDGGFRGESAVNTMWCRAYSDSTLWRTERLRRARAR